MIFARLNWIIDEMNWCLFYTISCLKLFLLIKFCNYFTNKSKQRNFQLFISVRMAEAEVEKIKFSVGVFLGSVKSRALGKWWRFRYSGHIGGGSIFSWGFCGLNSAIDTFFDETSFQRFKSKFMAYQSYTLVSTVYHRSTFCQIFEKIKMQYQNFYQKLWLRNFWTVRKMQSLLHLYIFWSVVG